MLGGSYIIFMKLSMASFTFSSSVWLCRSCGEKEVMIYQEFTRLTPKETLQINFFFPPSQHPAPAPSPAPSPCSHSLPSSLSVSPFVSPSHLSLSSA